MFSSLRSRLSIIVLLALLPILGLTVYSAVLAYENAADNVKTDTQHLAETIAANQAQLGETTRVLLNGLAEVSATFRDDPETCHHYFADLQAVYPYYANMGIIEGNGLIGCSAVMPQVPTDVSDRAYFQRALTGQGFVHGDYQIGRVTFRPILIYAYSLFTADGELDYMLYAALDLAWMNNSLAQLALPEGASVTILDGNGTVLLRYPNPDDHVGTQPLDNPMVRAALRVEDISTPTEYTGLSGKKRLYTFKRLTIEPAGGELLVALGLPPEVAYQAANAQVRRELIALGLITLTSLTLAWLGGKQLILNQIDQLVQATQGLGQGDLSTRTQMHTYQGELGELGRQFDAMAAMLEKRDEHLRRLQAEHIENERLRMIFEKEREVYELKSRFLSMASHEFRNPLAAIIMAATTLERFHTQLSAEERVKDLQRILKQATHMEGILEDMLVYGRAEAGKIEFHPCPIDLRPFCEEIAAAYPKVEMQVEAQTVLADPKLLRQILDNLISNAVKYSPNGNAVQVAVQALPEGTLFRVEDHGIGILPSDYDRLFQAFQRGSNVGQIEGNGLGLAITQKAVELHRGTISVTSEVGVGTTFTVIIPGGEKYVEDFGH